VETFNFLLSVSKPGVQNYGLCVTVALIDTPKVFQGTESVCAACSNKVWRLTFNLMVLLPHLLNSKVKRDISNYHIWNVILILWPVVFYLLLWEESRKAFCVCVRTYVACARRCENRPWSDLPFGRLFRSEMAPVVRGTGGLGLKTFRIDKCPVLAVNKTTFYQASIP